jgi:simple sugar transport system substrate-binding protein
VTTTTAKKYTIATVVKMDPYPWFNRMRVGVQKFSQKTGHKAFLIGPPRFDGMLQVQAIEDVLRQGVDALCVVPFFPQALEMVLSKARRQGIVVITNEASNQRNTDYNLEAFDNEMYGVRMMDHLARYMGTQGEYVTFVESVVTKAHMEWAESAIARQKEHYPDMNLVTAKLEHQGDLAAMYVKTKHFLKNFPNLKGILGFGMPAPPGAAKVIEEEGLQRKITIVGTSLVSVCGQYLNSGTVKLISFWDPADQGYVLNTLALKVLNGELLADNIDFGVPGYTNVKKHGKILYGSAWIDVTKENMHHYDF